MRLKILGNKQYFWQWDTGQKVLVEDAPNCGEVHFSNDTKENAIKVSIRQQDESRVADVPNILLQEAKTIKAYLVYCSDDGAETCIAYTFQVCERPKPEDYIYTETEMLTYQSLEKRIKTLESGGASPDAIDKAVTDTKIQELTREVRLHNGFAQRMPVVEEQIKVINHRIADLERGEQH